MANINLVGEFIAGAGTGALGGPPSGHNYKRAVYRPPPKEFTVEVLQPTKFGSGYCYGMRITSLQTEASDARSTKSVASFSEYEIWRRWEDCLWFQEILEGEYALMARQKRARLQAGKGVKKNGVYIHSDQAASFESLPPGPDANMIAKDIHAIIPRLTKKGTLFRASQATIEQRGREFEAMINGLFKEDVPTLMRELRDSRVCRDFFGYWRRDLDHDRKRGKARPSSGGDGEANHSATARNSVASSAFSMYFSASNISLQVPGGFSDLPPSPGLHTFNESSRPSSMLRDDEPRRRSTGKSPASYAASDSSASTASIASSSRHPGSAPHNMTFFVSERGSLALALPEDDAQAEYINSPLSAPARVQPVAWSRDGSRPFPSEEDIGSPRNIAYAPEISKPRPEASADFHHGLQALPEDSELVSDLSHSAHSEIEEVSRVLLRRQRNNSCPDRANRNCLVFPPDAPRSAGATTREFATIDALHVETDPRGMHLLRDQRGLPQSTRDPRTPGTASNSSRTSSMVFSSFSADVSSRSSWRTSMASMTSETSFAPSFTSSFANGSCADFGRPPVSSSESLYSVAPTASVVSIPELPGDGRETALGHHQHRESVTTIGSMLSDFSIDSSILPRSLTPPPSGLLRRSLSAGSRVAPSITSGMGMPASEEFWYEQQEDLIDAYFYDPGIHAPPVRPEEPPRTPERKLQHEPFHKEVASPDRFPKPFRDRPPGQFHLPWSPQDSSRPPTPSPASPASPASPFPSSGSFAQHPSVPAPVPTGASPPPTTPNSPTGTESLTLKAVLHESIVLLRVSRTWPLLEVRERLREKLAVQEGVKLLPSFVIGWAPPVPARAAGGLLALRGRPRSNSASSAGSLSPASLRYVYTEQDWQAALAACASGKMTVRLFNAQPI
ncbi:hypothetical protein BV20DRAFT_969822 [Pilatotrama ljubarskyi]|nr:hypothetical protein BV20DRAFT_969822 [Pilatotrama ljubarskyi]